MPIPRWIGRLNKHLTNRFFLLLSGWLPLFAILTHRGRRSGKEYRVPLMAFREGDGFLFALTYGKKVDWARNLLHHDSGMLRYGSRTYNLRNISLIPYPEKRDSFPPIIRWALDMIEIEYCIVTETIKGA